HRGVAGDSGGSCRRMGGPALAGGRNSVTDKAVASRGIDTVPAEDARDHASREDRSEGCIEYVEPTGEGAVGRHHHALAITGKASGSHAAPAPDHPRARMQVTCNFTRRRPVARQMAEDERAKLQLAQRPASEILRR